MVGVKDKRFSQDWRLLYALKISKKTGGKRLKILEKGKEMGHLFSLRQHKGMKENELRHKNIQGNGWETENYCLLIASSVF